MVELLVALAALLCGLVTGLLLGFAIVAMPGIATLDDRAHLRAFQVMDRVIQDRQPVFMLVWVGSVVAVLAAVVVGLPATDGLRRLLLIAAGVGWIAGVQVPTATINIPLNNAVQRLDVAALDDATAAAERDAFEARWNRWNAIRSAVGVLVCAALLGVLAL